jgi:hypothetical protein
MKHFALFFAALLCASMTAVSAYARDYDDISIKVETVILSTSGTGYGEYRATIINRSITKAHQVTFESWSPSFDGIGVRRTVEVAPSSAVTISIIAPGIGYSPVADVLIDGERQKEQVEIDISRTNSWVNRLRNRYFLLVSPDVDKSGLMGEATVVEGFNDPATGENEVAHLAYKSPLSEWSANWISYSGFDGVVMTSEELRAAPAAVRAALWSFTECGGSLLIISAGGALEIPERWLSRPVASFEVEAHKDEETEGLLKTVESENAASNKITVTLSKEAPSYFAGFGKVTILDAATVKNITPAQWQSIKYSLTRSRPWGKRYGEIVDVNNDFPVIERIGIPVRGLFVLMLTFVIVIGPINLFWLYRKRRKIWMLWTVPAIALLTCVAVTGFALFGEGVRATSRVETFTILDESSHRASTIGWTAFYTPITPSEGLHFSQDTELTPVRPTTWYHNNGGRSNTIDVSNDQHLESGWITARVPAYFKFRKSETRRERLTIREEGDGAISVVNGLGADIRELWLADRNGSVYSAGGIRAGAEAKLSPANLKLSGNGAGLRELFISIDWLAKMKDVDKWMAKAPEGDVNLRNFLSPGSYLAHLDTSPFIEDGLKNVKTRKGRAFLYGVSASITPGTPGAEGEK